jgi:hypothetical protein
LFDFDHVILVEKVVIVPLDPAYKAGLAEHLPVTTCPHFPLGKL